MSDFNFYLNRQGIRGHKGDKGDQGFSPYFTEEVNTMNEYKLRVHNEFDSFVTDNLRGNKIQLVNPDGTYVKYDKETGNFYVDSADYATGEIYGQVRLATLADVDLFDSESVLTPDVLSDTLPRYLINNDGNITITQGSDSKTEIKLGSELHNVSRIYRNDTQRYLTAGDFYERNNPVRKFVPNPDSLAVGYYLSYNTSQFKTETDFYVGNIQLALSDSINSKINSSATQAEVNNLRGDLDTERTTRLNADNAINSELAAERSERQVQDAALQSQLGTKLTVDNIKAGDNIELVKSGNNVTINSTGGGGGAIIDDETVSTDKVFSSSRTSELVGEVGNDLQDLAQRVNDIESLKVPNVVIIGEPMIQNGQVSDLDEQNHLQFPFVIERKGRPFICDFEFTTGADVTRQQNIIDSRCSVAVAIRNSRLVGALSSNGQTFNLGEKTITDTIRPYTTYYCRLEGWKDGTEYNYRLLLDTNPNIGGSSSFVRWSYLEEPIFPTTMTIGSEGNSFDGVIDLNKWSLKIDNDLVWLGMDNVGQAVSANVSLSNINVAGVKVINDLIDAKIGDINTILDNINGEVI